MDAPSIDSLRQLDLEQRLELVAELWNSIVDDVEHGGSEALPLPPEHAAVLAERLAEDDADPGGAIPWAEARASLRR